MKKRFSISNVKCVRGLAFSLIITSTMLSGCSNTDYELRLVENEKQLSINTSDIKTTSIINFSQEVSTSDRVLVSDTNNISYDFTDVGDYREELDDSIVTEEDVIREEIDTEESKEETEIPVVEQETEETPVVEQEAEETPVVEQETEETPVVEQETEETPVVAQETEETPVTQPVESQEEVTATETDECIHLDNEHIISQTLIDYIGAGNYAKWIATDIPDCSKGLSIYDYMDKFNMTKGFFYNLTANDPTYAGINLYAYD